MNFKKQQADDERPQVVTGGGTRGSVCLQVNKVWPYVTFGPCWKEAPEPVGWESGVPRSSEHHTIRF